MCGPAWVWKTGLESQHVPTTERWKYTTECSRGRPLAFGSVEEDPGFPQLRQTGQSHFDSKKLHWWMGLMYMLVIPTVGTDGTVMVRQRNYTTRCGWGTSGQMVIDIVYIWFPTAESDRMDQTVLARPWRLPHHWFGVRDGFSTESMDDEER